MKQVRITIGKIPALLYGETSEKAYLFVHGQKGSKEDAADFAETAQRCGFQVLSVDLPGHGERGEPGECFVPWIAAPELEKVWTYMERQWAHVSLCAYSIGAWFSMLALGDKKTERAIFVSPILDMERLIEDMMLWAEVKKEQLEKEKTIATSFGQTLSWEYYLYAKEHPINTWNADTRLLYGSKDHLTARAAVDGFAKRFGCLLTVVENGEHWFHTPTQIQVMKDFFCKNIQTVCKDSLSCSS